MRKQIKFGMQRIKRHMLPQRRWIFFFFFSGLLKRWRDVAYNPFVRFKPSINRKYTLKWSLKRYNPTTCWGFLQGVSCETRRAAFLISQRSPKAAFQFEPGVPARSWPSQLSADTLIHVWTWAQTPFMLMFSFISLRVPSKGFTLRGKASFRFSLNLSTRTILFLTISV